MKHIYYYITHLKNVLRVFSWGGGVDSIDCSLPVSSIHGISQGKIPEWVAIPFSGGSS